MATLAFTGFESGSVGNFEIQSTSGTPTLSTTTVRTGGYSLNISTSTTQYAILAGRAGNGTNSLFASATTYSQFSFRYATKPASNQEEIFQVQDTLGATKIKLCLNSSGNIEIYSSSNSLVATGSTVLSANTWYYIDVYSTTNSVASSYEVKINGVSESSGTCTQTNTVAGRLILGRYANRNSQTTDCFYDDVYVNDSGFAAGRVEVQVMAPDANGSTMTWNAGTGGSDYTQVNEVPVSTTEYVQSPVTGAPNLALFDLESPVSAGVYGTILSFLGICYTREDISVTSSTVFRIYSGSSSSDTFVRNGSTTFAGQGKYADTDPATSSAWTISGLDAVEIGALENNNVAIRCSSVLGFVLYIPTGPTNLKSYNTNVKANIKSINTNVIANVKSLNTNV